jgi:uncharacterized protein (TIGR02246 family)
MPKRILIPLSVLSGATLLAAGCATPPPAPDVDALRRQVTETEFAFARTMADRDLKAFADFVASDAVFLNGGNPLRGRDAVVEHWKRFFATPAAPFSWKPDRVEVLASGTLAQSQGPVMDPAGKVFARFHSVWRLDAPGVWHIVFDDGVEACNCAKP